jgi:excisionase family DNA binding protein
MTLAAREASATRQHDSALDDIVERIVCGLPQLNTIDSTAELLGKSERTIRAYISRGLIVAIRPCGGAPRIPRSEIERVLREGAA